MSGRGGKTRTSWKAGQSGNPKGRPKDALTVAIRKAMEEKHYITIDGKRRLMTEKEILINVLRREARAGNLKAIRELFDRGYGKPVQAVDVSGDITTEDKNATLTLQQMQAILKQEMEKGMAGLADTVRSVNRKG